MTVLGQKLASALKNSKSKKHQQLFVNHVRAKKDALKKAA